MARITSFSIAIALFTLPSVGWSQTTQPTSQPATSPASQPTSQASLTETDLAVNVLPAEAWINARVSEAAARLGETEAGQLVWAAIEYHGGLASWYGNGPVAFRFNYVPLGDRPPVDTDQVIDTWSSRAWHRLWDNADATFGWNGAVAWVDSPVDLPTNARFWALTPYYFIGVPFVLADPGVNLVLEGTWAFEGREYHQVRATFDPGTGDSPGDYYVALIDTETHRIGGVRYIVAYPGFFPSGGHTPEKLFTYDEEQVVEDIVFPVTFRALRWSTEGPGEHVTDATMSEVRFLPETPASLFEPPESAVVLDGF